MWPHYKCIHSIVELYYWMVHCQVSFCSISSIAMAKFIHSICHIGEVRKNDGSYSCRSWVRYSQGQTDRFAMALAVDCMSQAMFIKTCRISYLWMCFSVDAACLHRLICHSDTLVCQPSFIGTSHTTLNFSNTNASLGLKSSEYYLDMICHLSGQKYTKNCLQYFSKEELLSINQELLSGLGCQTKEQFGSFESAGF